ncbi:DNA (cytosine-5-)-methyltransferase N-terminal subunit [Mycoplasmopsis opalescens]|uniref:DNA (cytosine-5-)-methyltransferase N-terminal subunit n=1 Tax=Mycoplasmopsis opalescens TaxID=114886 RepID=UPI00056B38CD|nr:hypothetical protein [Mycoplasmopsis opalescens]
MKSIRIFEFFSGIGSQIKALKFLEEQLKFKTKSLGACDFYIDAIVAYMAIHHGVLKPENNLSKDKMVDILQHFSFSSNSKDQVSIDYFKRMNEGKLRKLFAYLYSFLNNEYFNTRYSEYLNNNALRERESERLRH